jgi:drug/metabolite transporter (DMT)-like permease
VDPIGALLLTGSALSWATGTVAARRASLPTSSALASGMQMLGGGACLGLAGLATGELPAALAMQPTSATVASFLWLMLGGSLVGFTAYQYLLRASTPAVASTYAYVNPIVAVFLGWWWAGEPLGPRVFAAGALIVGAVVLITTAASPVQAPAEVVRASR